MQTENRLGPEKMSLALGHILLLPEEVDCLVEERPFPGLASVVCQWRSEDSNQRGYGDNPLLAGSNALA